jgi:hypothetical protein
MRKTQNETEYCAPAGNLEGGAKNLGPHEFRHDGVLEHTGTSWTKINVKKKKPK